MSDKVNRRASELRDRLDANPEDVDAALKLADVLLKTGSKVSLDVREIALRHHLDEDPERDDLAYQLATVLMEQGKPISPDLELASIRHNLKEDPGNAALLERFSIVAVAAVLDEQQQDAPVNPTESDYDIVRTAKRNLSRVTHNPQANELPSYGIRWNEYAERTRRDIEALDDPVSVLRFAQESVGFEHRTSAAAMMRHFALYEQELRDEFPQYADKIQTFDDPPSSNPTTQISLNGRQVSNIVPYLSRIILSCLTLAPSPEVVLELGGGYGAPARLWLSNTISQPKCYIIADIPESLFFAEVFLRNTFGADAVHYVEDDRPLNKEILDTCKVVLCPIPCLASLEKLPVDLVINTGSLQEMSEDWVAYYMEWLDRQEAKFFYSLNYAAQPLNYLAESVNLWSPRPSPRWQAKLLRMNPAFVRMQADRNFLESFYAKAPADLTVEEAQRRLDIIDEQALTIETFVSSMDIFRRCQNALVGYRILERATRELPTSAKEMLWLAEWLQDQEEHLTEQARASVADWLAHLLSERAEGVEGIAD